jgi:tetratricopeptide (TPR) repeat protein
MTVSRLESLQEFLRRDPEDSFTHYAIALEYVSLKRIPEAVSKFEELIRLDPAYVPAYQQLGSLLAQLGRTPEALATLQKGIAVAKEAGDAHSGAEMQEVVDELGD